MCSVLTTLRVKLPGSGPPVGGICRVGHAVTEISFKMLGWARKAQGCSSSPPC